MSAHHPVRQELRPKLGLGRENPKRFDAARLLAQCLELPTRGMDRPCCEALVVMMEPLADAIRDGLRCPDIDGPMIGHRAVQHLIYPDELVSLIGFFQLSNKLSPPVYVDCLDQQLRDHAGGQLGARATRLLQSWADERRSGPPSRRRASARQSGADSSNGGRSGP